MDNDTQSPIYKAYHAMLDADRLHGALRTEDTYRRVIDTQRTYYALLTAYNKARYSTAPLTLARTRAKTMFIRATQNKRTALTATQAEIADEQWNRALDILRRANNALLRAKEQRIDKRVAKQQQQTTTVHAIHPITRRRVRVTKEQAKQWSQ